MVYGYLSVDSDIISLGGVGELSVSIVLWLVVGWNSRFQISSLFFSTEKETWKKKEKRKNRKKKDSRLEIIDLSLALSFLLFLHQCMVEIYNSLRLV